MLKEVQGGNTVLIRGPASATVVNGKVSVLGKELAEEDRIIVRRGKSLPFEAEENSTLDIVLGAEAGVSEMVGSTIPDSWKKAVKDILLQQKPCTVMVLGEVDLGKTTFSTFLINRALVSKFRPAIIDLDLGQSDIGPPTAIGLGLISKPIADLFTAKPAAVLFMGLTSPNGIAQRVISGLESIRKQIPDGEVDLTVINTDGWVIDNEAYSYKMELTRRTCPNVVVGIQRGEELEPIHLALEGLGFRIFRLFPSPALKRRDREERKGLREQSYKKYLGKPVPRSLPLKWIQLEYTPLGSGNALDLGRLESLEETLGCKIVHCEDGPKGLFIVIDEKGEVNEGSVLAVEKLIQKNVYVVREGEERGLLAGLLSKNRDFLGLGIISKIDYKNETMKIHTSYKDEIRIVQFGLVKIDESGKELGITTSFSTRD